MPIVEYHTQSGSIYEVDEEKKCMRQLKRSEACQSLRVTSDWRTFESMSIHGGISFIWGMDIADEKVILRTTVTSGITKIVIQQDLS